MATVKDIANRVGVSIGTVDRILHNRGRFSRVTADKVWKAVEELQYSPNVSARNLSKSKSLHIGVLIPFADQGDNYWGQPLLGMRKAAEELRGYQASLDVFGFKRDNRHEFILAAQEMFKKELDGYLMAPIFSEDSRQLLDRFHPKHPVVFFNTDVPNCNRICFIGQNSYRSGEVAARLLELLTKSSNEAHYLIIRANIDNKHLQDRVLGFRNRTRHRHVSEMVYEIGNIEKEELYLHALEEYISPNTTGIFVTDASVYRVADYLKVHALKNSIALVGCDLTKQNADRLEQESLDIILTQRPVEMGYQGVYLLYKHLILHEKLEDRIVMPIDIITKENYEFFM
jgi:LacI family transcriptional regulator